MNVLDREAVKLWKIVHREPFLLQSAWDAVIPHYRRLARHVRARERKKFKEGIDYCGRKFAESHQ
jgi:hypothetical protein